MNTDDFFDVNENPKFCLNGLTSNYKENIWINCENSENVNCCNYIGTNTANDITSLDDFDDFINKIDNKYDNKTDGLGTLLRNKLKQAECPDPTDELKNLIGFVDSVEVNHRLLKKQYNELIFSPNEVINVDENINKFRYLELDRKLEKYDKKTYSLYKIFFYIMLITSGTIFIKKQLKK